MLTKGRKVIGKKGLGKLSFFGISHEIEVTTRQAGLENRFTLDWDAMRAQPGDAGQNGDAEPAQSTGDKVMSIGRTFLADLGSLVQVEKNGKPVVAC